MEGFIPHLVDGGFSILQYVDHTILFMEHDIEKARNPKLILSAFKELSGLKINFHKSELFFLARPKTMLLCMLNYLATDKGNYLLGT
jgi:hypothetical protein